MNDIEQRVISLSYGIVCDYLLITHDLEKEIDTFKNIILTQDFMNMMYIIIHNMNNSVNQIVYPEITKENVYKILDYIEDNTECSVYASELKEELNKMNNFSYEKYYAEYMIRQNSLLLEQKSDIAWNLKDIEESIKYDYIVLAALYTDDMSFINNYYNDLILNKKFIYSVNKLLYSVPSIFENKNILKHTKTVIETNLELLKNDTEDVLKKYALQNCIKDEDNNCYIEADSLKIFEEMNLNTLMTMNNLELEPFIVENLKKYYDYLIIENYVNFDEEVNIDNVELDNVYDYIDNLVYLDKDKRKCLIDILNQYRNDLNGEELVKFNEYLNVVNSIEEKEGFSKICNFNKKIDKLTYFLSLIDKNNTYHKITESFKYDLYNYEILISNDRTFERNELYLNSTFAQYSIKRFLREFPSMFLNSKINERALCMINKYNNGYYEKKLIKEIGKKSSY